MNEFIEQFILECRELVEQAESSLQSLENSPRNAEALDELFRALHTLKGSAGIIDFVAMERALHAAETALSTIRADKGRVSARLNSDCLACLDLVARWIDEMESTGELPRGAEAQATALILRLDASATDYLLPPAVAGSDSGAMEAGAPASIAVESALSPNARRLLEAQIALLDETPDSAFAGHVTAAGTAAANALRYCGLGTAAEHISRMTAQSVAEKDSRKLREQIAEVIDSAVASPAVQAEPALRPDAGARILRIDAGKVEELVQLIGQLTVVKNAMGHLANVAQAEANPLAGPWKDQHAVLDRITAAAQRAVLGMRVLPLRTVFGRFPALMRELSASLGKPARLVIEGDDTEADKAIVEILFEPLMHVLRNAMDHGIEVPAIRIQHNKPAIATIVLRAFRQADRVLIEIEDDGAGVDVDRVRELAVKRGVVTAERLAEMNEMEIVDLVFAAGFSTAAKVTELSGRGVGMDAARATVSRMGGNVSIESRPGRGATIRFSLPFSVMMTQVMTVEAGGQTFGIPLDAVIETIRVPVGDIARVGAAQAIVHRDRTLPVFELANLLQVQHAQQHDEEAVIVITSYAGNWGGIRVDKPGMRMDVMLKPLEGLLSGTPGITGTTIMGDGRVLLVLNLEEIL